MPESKALLKSLTDVNGISGHEMQVKSLMKDYLTPVSDEIVETWSPFLASDDMKPKFFLS